MSKFQLDDHKIQRIGWEASPYTQGDPYASAEVGQEGVTRIDVAEQYLGEYSIIWLQIWKGPILFGRFNARNVDSVIYFEGDENESS